MNRTDIIRVVKELNLPEGEYWINTGAGLVLHGVKEDTLDVDMGCTDALFEVLLGKGCMLKVMNDGSRGLILNEWAEIFEDWPADSIVDIEGLPVATLPSIRKQKLKLGRVKDLEDIQLIDKFLEKYERGE